VCFVRRSGLIFVAKGVACDSREKKTKESGRALGAGSRDVSSFRLFAVFAWVSSGRYLPSPEGSVFDVTPPFRGQQSQLLRGVKDVYSGTRGTGLRSWQRNFRLLSQRETHESSTPHVCGTVSPFSLGRQFCDTTKYGPAHEKSPTAPLRRRASDEGGCGRRRRKLERVGRRPSRGEVLQRTAIVASEVFGRVHSNDAKDQRYVRKAPSGEKSG
jgi:hypothetical protein